MLVLTRRLGETFMIDDDIEITILGRGSRGQVKIGVIAPSNKRVLRKELYKKKSLQVLNDSRACNDSSEDTVKDLDPAEKLFQLGLKALNFKVLDLAKYLFEEAAKQDHSESKKHLYQMNFIAQKILKNNNHHVTHEKDSEDETSDQ